MSVSQGDLLLEAGQQELPARGVTRRSVNVIRAGIVPALVRNLFVPRR